MRAYLLQIEDLRANVSNLPEIEYLVALTNRSSSVNNAPSSYAYCQSRCSLLNEIFSAIKVIPRFCENKFLRNKFRKKQTNKQKLKQKPTGKNINYIKKSTAFIKSS